jgi:hypothetical protein
MKRTLFILIAVLLAAALALPACGGKKKTGKGADPSSKSKGGGRAVLPSGSAPVGSPSSGGDAEKARPECAKEYEEAVKIYSQAKIKYEALLAKQERSGISEGEKNEVIGMYQKVIDICARIKKPLVEIAKDNFSAQECETMESKATQEQHDLRSIETGGN